MDAINAEYIRNLPPTPGDPGFKKPRSQSRSPKGRKGKGKGKGKGKKGKGKVIVKAGGKGQPPKISTRVVTIPGKGAASGGGSSGRQS
jgi:hypothetical protein